MLDLVNRHPYCNCPDFSGRQAQVYITNQLSLARNRAWTESNYGPKNSGFCKHLYAVQLLRGDAIEFVDDPPVEGQQPYTFPT